MSNDPGAARHDAKRITGSGFAGDDGRTDASVAQALTDYASSLGTPGESRAHGEVLLALAERRVLVPVVAVLGEVEHDEAGLAHDKSSDMAAVLIQRPDGRRALLAFTGTDAMAAWDPRARPVPVATSAAAQAAVQEDAAALVLDLAGPTRLVVDGDDLRALAAGWRLVRLDDGLGWIAPA